MINLSVKTRVFLTAFIPMLLITTILSYYFLRSQFDEIANSIDVRGSSMAQHLANASEYGMFSGNRDNLNNLLRQTMEEEGIFSLSIFDDTGNLFVRASDKQSNRDLQDNSQSDIRYFRHPIILHTTDASGFDDFNPVSDSSNNEEILGWIEIGISTQQIDERRDRLISDAALIILSGLLASILLSLWMGRSLTNPIIRLTQAVHNVENGDMNEIIDTTSSGEIGTLEKGFMSMLGKIRISQKDLQDKIDETTIGLKNSLTIVEKQNQELTDARTRALEASKTKSRFLANISHEIRTPMNGILGFVRLLKKSKLSKEQYDYLDTIEKSSDNLLHLIEDILDLSRVEEGKILIKSKVFNLRDYVEDVIMLMAPAVLEKGLDITYFYYSDVPTHISAPYERIRQVLINFIGNAIKFSEQGTIVVRVMLDDETDNSIKISVADQGIGIPDIDKEQIFTPFTQIDDTSTRKYGGTGLGLAISKSIAKAMGGNIGLEDNPNKGSVFWFTFPYEKSNHTGSLSQGTPIHYPIPVFLYDSNLDTLHSIHANVSEAGFPVTDYSNQSEVFDALENHKGRSICMLSLSYIEVSNPETKILVENIASLSDTGLFLLISSIESSDTEKARECGADACLTKPYRYQEMVSCLHKLSNPNDEPVTHTPPSQPANPKKHALNDINILIAEDNAINTKLIKTILADSGATFSHANNGVEAIEAFNENDFDIILMDIQMPIMNGKDATITIRNSGEGEKGKSIPIIGMTANALTEDIDDFKKSGFSDILIKPISVDNLLHEIQYWFNKSQHTSITTLKNSQAITDDADSNPDNNEQNSNQLGISKQLSDDLYRMLVDELPMVSSQLKQSYSAKDWGSLRKHVHKLLGGISYCNVPELKLKTLNLQTSLRNKSASLASDFEALIHEIERLA